MSDLLAPAPAHSNRPAPVQWETSPVSRLTERRPTWLERHCRALLLRQLAELREGRLVLTDADGAHMLGDDGGPTATIRVLEPRLYTMLFRGGSLAGAEAFLRGYWDCDDLVTALQIFARQAGAAAALERGPARLLSPLRAALGILQRNTRSGSRRNIAAHYDLSNEFFAIWLDPTMTYSCGLFAAQGHSQPAPLLEAASLEKYRRIADKLQLSAGDRLLEIGCGWGGFAVFAAREYGCRVTATTISAAQFEYARHRIDEQQLADRVTLLASDYRDLERQTGAAAFDKLVSIEMIEAVGEQFLDAYFGACSRLLKPAGAMLLQAIVMPDFRYDRYRRSVDFIQRYVFPGGFLPSFSAIGQSLRRATDFRVTQLDDYAGDYAQTLACWRENFWARIDDVRRLGFDDRFIRTWHYYLAYCEAGFREQIIGLAQLRLDKPRGLR